MSTAAELSPEAYAVLRRCENLTSTVVGISDFLRCGQDLGSKAFAIANEIRGFVGDSGDEVFASYNDERGDYVRVNVGSNAYRLVCRMAA